MTSLGVTLISDKIKIVDITSCPLIFEVISVKMYQSGMFNSDNFVIIDGFEESLQLYPTQTHFSNHQITDKIFWFYSPEELEGSKSYVIEFKTFIFKNILNGLKTYNRIVVYNLSQLHLIGVKVFELTNVLTNTSYLFDGISVFIIDLEYFSFILNKKIDNIHCLLPSQIQLISFEEIRLNLKSQGLVDKIFSYSNFFEYFKTYNYESEDYYEYFCLLAIYFFDIVKYKSLDEKYSNKLYSALIGDETICKFNNPYENIINVEKYLSNVKIKGIDFNKYPELEFPIKDKVVQYTYSGIDNTTGRIFPINLSNKQSLQTLNKERKDLLNAEYNCLLIEFDYKAFEFDFLCQLTGLNDFCNTDPHLTIVNYLFEEKETINDLNNFRTLGKSINYSFIYGMLLDKIVDLIIGHFYSEEEITQIGMSDLEELKKDLKNKLSNYEINAAVELLTDKLLKENFNPSNNLLRTYFGRFIRIDKLHAILNNFLQGTAVDFICLKILLIIDLLKARNIDLNKNKIIMQNHDSILLQLENDVINDTDIFESIVKIMNADINGLFGRVKYEFGSNWGVLI